MLTLQDTVNIFQNTVPNLIINFGNREYVVKLSMDKLNMTKAKKPVKKTEPSSLWKSRGMDLDRVFENFRQDLDPLHHFLKSPFLDSQRFQKPHAIL